MIWPNSSDNSSSESASWIHARSGVRNDAKMPQCDGESDSQWCDETRVWLVLIGNAENDQHKNEAEEELKSESLPYVDILAQCGVTEAFCSLHISNQCVQWGNRSDSSGTLRKNIQNRAKNGNSTSGQKTDGDGWINVTSGNVPDGLKSAQKHS